jgi:arginine N-succinyltransferase
VQEAGTAAGGSTYLIAHNGADGEFRCVLDTLPGGQASGASLSHAARAALGVQEGDAVRCVPLHQPHQEESLGDAQ